MDPHPDQPTPADPTQPNHPDQPADAERPQDTRRAPGEPPEAATPGTPAGPPTPGADTGTPPAPANGGWQAPGQPPAGQQQGGDVPGQPGFWSPEQPPPWGAPPPPQANPQPPLYGTPPPPPYSGPYGGQQQPPPGAPQQPSPYGAPQQPPYGGQQQPPYDAPQQPSYGGPQQPTPYGTPQYPSAYGNPQQLSPYGQQPSPYGQPPYGQPPYGQPPFGQGPYGQQQYGYAPYGVPVEPSVVEAPPGTPYHRLGRTAKHRWWRPLVAGLFLAGGVVLATIVVVLVWVVVHAMAGGDLPEVEGNNLFSSDIENLAITLVMLAVLTPVVLLTVRLIQRRPAFSVASVLNKIRWRWLLLSCVPAAGYLVLNYGLSLALDAVFPPSEDTVSTDDGSWVGFASFIGPALLILFLVPFQSAAEEFIFRGWLVQGIGAYGPDNTDGTPLVSTLKRVLRSPWPALVISAVVFFLAHGYTGWARLDIFLFAMTIGWLTIRTGGLEAGISLHALNNIVAFMLPAATGQLSGWDDQGGAPWTLVAIDAPCLALYAVAVVWLAKRKEIARYS